MAPAHSGPGPCKRGGGCSRVLPVDLFACASPLPLPRLQANPGAQPHPPGSPQAEKGAGGWHLPPCLGGRLELWGKAVKADRDGSPLEEAGCRFEHQVIHFLSLENRDYSLLGTIKEGFLGFSTN